LKVIIDNNGIIFEYAEKRNLDKNNYIGFHITNCDCLQSIHNPDQKIQSLVRQTRNAKQILDIDDISLFYNFNYIKIIIIRTIFTFLILIPIMTFVYVITKLMLLYIKKK